LFLASAILRRNSVEAIGPVRDPVAVGPAVDLA